MNARTLLTLLRSKWAAIAGAVLAIALPFVFVVAMNAGRVVKKSRAPRPEARHWGLLPGGFIERRNCSVAVEHWYGGKSELLVYPSTHDQLQRGDWYFGQP